MMSAFMQSARIEVGFNTLAQFGHIDANDRINTGVILSGPIKNRGTDFIFMDFFAVLFKRTPPDVEEKTRNRMRASTAYLRQYVPAGPSRSQNLVPLYSAESSRLMASVSTRIQCGPSLPRQGLIRSGPFSDF